MKTTMEPEVMPGLQCGMMMDHQMTGLPAPRSWAASIRLSSRLSMTETSGTTMNNMDV